MPSAAQHVVTNLFRGHCQDHYDFVPGGSCKRFRTKPEARRYYMREENGGRVRVIRLK